MYPIQPQIACFLPKVPNQSQTIVTPPPSPFKFDHPRTKLNV